MNMQRILPLAASLLAFAAVPAFALPASAMVAPQGQTERGSARYTEALNAFMDHGWHAVDDMHMKNGDIVGTGVNSKGQVRQVTFEPGSGQVRAG